MRDSTLQDLIGAPALRLLHLLNPGLLQPQRLRDLVVGLHSRAGLLLNTDTRARLLDLLSPKEAQQLATLLSLPVDPERPIATYSALRDVSIRRNSKREQTLLDFFLLDPPDRTPLPTPPSHSKAQTAYPLFPINIGLHAGSAGLWSILPNASCSTCPPALARRAQQ